MTLVDFSKIAIKECGEKLINMEDCGLVADLKYFQQGLSDDDKIYLRRGVLKRLKKAKEYLPAGCNFKIWDGYRSRKVQDKIWQLWYARIKREHIDWNEETVTRETDKFVTRPNNPERIPPHATGGAVDLIIIDQDGEELDFGTEFDDFSEMAGRDFFEIKKNLNHAETKIKNNRNLLVSVMSAQGFSADADEWWHFDYGNQLCAKRMGENQAIYGEI